MTPDRLLHLRKALYRTQQQMADLLGTTRVTWQRWESGDTVPMPVYRRKLAKLLTFVGEREKK